MGAPSKSKERRREWTPLVARAFIELGYRGTTSAELASRCGVRENVLYRVWATKKEMFLDSVEWVYVATMQAWDQFAAEEGGRGDKRSVAERILENQADYHGRMRLYRILFAGLSEDDPEIKTALRGVYLRFAKFIAGTIEEHRGRRRRETRAREAAAGAAAWAFVGLGAVIDIQRELEILPVGERRGIMKEIGRLLLDGAAG